MPVDLWTSDPFLDEATAWVRQHAASAGINLDGSRDQPHARPWSSAIVFGTDRGRVWFKVNGPGTAYEPALTLVLAKHVPELAPELLAVDLDRGWSLMRDAGPTLRTLGAPDELWDRWAVLLQRYAAAQLTLSTHVDDLLATGIHDVGPVAGPAALRDLLTSLVAVPEDEGGLSPEDAERMSAALPQFDAWCAELAASGIPTTVNHDDLHSSNVCVGANGTRIIDWGDAGLSHPFATMLATLNSIAWHAEVERDDPRVARVRDAYLEVFTDIADLPTLRHWVSLARRVGTLGKARSYVNAFEGEPLSAQAEMEWPARGWLLEMLDPA
ncbi:MAG: aminoglycoside phosphotransferase family protein, partial [Nocardioides sp.]